VAQQSVQGIQSTSGDCRARGKRLDKGPKADLTPIMQPKREALPYLAFSKFEADYEAPQVSEGFSEVVAVKWGFVGSEEERKRWKMWHQIDGK